MPEIHPRDRGPWSRPLLEPGGRSQRPNPAADSRGRSPRPSSHDIPRHPTARSRATTAGSRHRVHRAVRSARNRGRTFLWNPPGPSRALNQGLDPGDGPRTYPPASGTPDVPAPLGFASRGLRGRFASLRTPSGALRCLGLRPPRAPRRAAPLRPLRSSRRRHSQRPGSYACYASLRSAARSVALCAVP